jgi:DnaK suppressor protein
MAEPDLRETLGHFKPPAENLANQLFSASQIFRLMELGPRTTPPRSSQPKTRTWVSSEPDDLCFSPLSVMAAKKTTPKPAPETKAAKTAVKPEKAAAKIAKETSKAAPAPKEIPAPKSAKKAASAPAEKKVAKSAPAPVKEAKPVKEIKEAPVAVATAKPVVAAKKVAAVRPRSSVVDFPAPPAPIKPPFVPPKATAAPADGPVASGSNGSHSPAFVQRQRQRLLDLRDDLVDAVSGMARDTIRNGPEGSEASGSGQHQGDAGSDAYDRDFALSVLAKEQDALYEIEQALRRIQAGSYGICEISARKIPQARLEVIPFARLTVECQAQWEKEYGNRRFRPSNEVGFSGGKYVDDDESETVSLDEDDD